MIKNRIIKHNIFPLISDLKEALLKDSELIFGYVFGSYGINRSSPLSDVDLAFYVLPDKDGFEKKLALMAEITSILKTDEVDIVILNKAPLAICYQVLKTGRLLFSKDERLRLKFVNRVFNIYCDTEPLRKSAEANLLKRIKENRIGIRQ
ncbi:MAG: type VII toxin-antitoxin system MntA family adenylyltransferase antitoxin [bacterium]